MTIKKRDIYLTSVLLILIGITIGTIVALYTMNSNLAPLSEVRFTEIKKNDEPLFNEKDLAEVDARFLFKSVAEKTIQSVVYIETIVPIKPTLPNDKNHKFDDEFWEKIMPKRARTVGSGVIITEDGYILTNHHVIESAVKNGIKVILNDKREYNAKLVGQDPSTDLAVLKISANHLPAAIVGNSDAVDVGEWVMAVGNPFRLKSTVTAGIVSALSRDVRIINDTYRIESFIQTDAAINSGNSGGALVNTSAQLIGINTAIASRSGNYQGYGFAVPSNLAMKVASDIIEYGNAKRVLLGITIASIDFERALELGMNEVRGVEIITTSKSGVAYKSGIRNEDVVLKVNGRLVNESNQLQEKVAVMRPGDIVNLEIFRNGEIITKEIELEEASDEMNELLAFDDEPLSLDEISEEDNENTLFEFDLGFIAKETENDDFDTQLMVTKVYKYSEAWNRGLRNEYTITAVDGESVTTIHELRKIIRNHLQQNKTVILEILNKDGAKGYIKMNK